MRITRIFTTVPLRAGTSIALEPRPSQHIARVLRMRAGDELVLFDGAGAEHPSTIASIDKKSVHAQVGPARREDTASPLAIHLGIALSRGERMDWVVQKATELGVCAISPLFTGRVEVKLAGERAEKKLRHWRQVAISACEQCGRNTLPDINAVRNIDSWLADTNADRRFVLHHRALRDNSASAETPASVALLIGPEGGLSDAEIQRAEQAGYEALRLGPRVLRTETAPLAAIAILQSIWGDMKPEL